VFASLSAKRVAKENGIDIANIPAAEGNPRIVKADVIAYIENNKVKATPLARKIADEKGIDLQSIEKSGDRIYSSDLGASTGQAAAAEAAGKNQTVTKDISIPVNGMRKVIASRMKQSLDIAAHLTTVIDIDMSEIIKLRAMIIDDVREAYDIKVSYNDIIIKCVAQAVEKYPRVNCVFTEKEIIQKGQINIGMAVAVGEGLVVPVINNANLLSIGRLSSESKRLAKKAHDTGLAPDDMHGGTITVSNLGMYGITSFTSIINQPESAILSIGAVRKVPVVTDEGDIAVRPVVTITISYDHRAMDGSMSAIFLKTLKEIMENPYKLMV